MHRHAVSDMSLSLRRKAGRRAGSASAITDVPNDQNPSGPRRNTCAQSCFRLKLRGTFSKSEIESRHGTVLEGMAAKCSTGMRGLRRRQPRRTETEAGAGVVFGHRDDGSPQRRRSCRDRCVPGTPATAATAAGACIGARAETRLRLVKKPQCDRAKIVTATFPQKIVSPSTGGHQ